MAIETKRNRRAGVEDRWHVKKKPLPDGERCGGRCAARFAPSSRHGQGSRWLARFVAADGREVTQSFEWKDGAERWLSEQSAAVTRKDFIHRERSAMTVGELAETWIDSLEARKPSTRAGYLARWEKHVKPKWGKTQLSDIEHEDVVRWVGMLASGRAATTERGLSSSSISTCLSALSQVCALAVRSRRLPVNPCVGVVIPKPDVVKEDRRRYLTQEELVRLAAAAVSEDGDATHETAILILGFVGLRFGELAGLQVRDVKFGERTTLQVRRNAVECADGTVELGTPKSGKAREVSVAGFLTPRLRLFCTGRRGDEFLFPQGGLSASVSKPLRRTNWVSRVFYPAAVAAGFVDSKGKAAVSPHDLRHSAASMMIHLGANVKAVQAQLGHARASITLDVYADLLPQDLSGIGDAIDAAFRAGGQDDPDGVVVQLAR